MPGCLASNILATMLVRSARVGLPHQAIFRTVPALASAALPPDPPVLPPLPPLPPLLPGEPPVRAPPVETLPPVSSSPPVLLVFLFRVGCAEQATQPAAASRDAATHNPFR